MGKTLVYIVFGGIWLCVGVGMTVYGCYTVLKIRRARNWPSVAAHLEQIALVDASDSEGEAWVVEARYTYSVDGASHTGTRVGFGYFASSDRRFHLSLYEGLKHHLSLKAHYNPARPQEACLIQWIDKDLRAFALFGLGWLAVGGLGILLLPW